MLFIAVPAQYYETGIVMTPDQAISVFMQRPLRYLLAGILFFLAMLLGFVCCYFPGLIIALVMPIYANRVFLMDQSIPDAFAASFQADCRSPNGLSFVGIQLLAWIVVAIVTMSTCGLAGLVPMPMSNFYIQNVAYSKGLVR